MRDAPGFTASQLTRLNDVGAIELGFPHGGLADDRMRAVTHGDLRIGTHR
ncbi:hypothetical protein [Streptomyces anthocyanicus]|nr:hypothetical protein OHA15_39230 [Streptomyces anthocyanicus]